jgi:hypothetical protein
LANRRFNFDRREIGDLGGNIFLTIAKKIRSITRASSETFMEQRLTSQKPKLFTTRKQRW